MAKKKGGKGGKKGPKPSGGDVAAAAAAAEAAAAAAAEAAAEAEAAANVPQAAVGISLGSLIGSVAVGTEGADVEIVANDLGFRTTPMVVGFDGEDVNIGHTGAESIIRNGKNTATNFYSLLGRKFADAEVQAGLKGHSCDVVDKDGMAWCQPAEREAGAADPAELTSLVLGQLKAAAATKCAKECTDVVLAVAHGASDELKAALTTATGLVGLKIQQFISEPIAVCLAYDLGQEDSTKEHNVVVYDVGGHQTTATVVSVRGGVYRVLGSAVDTNFNGNAIDKSYVDVLLKEHKKATKLDITGDKKAMAKLSAAAVNAKELLSAKVTTPIAIDSLFEGADWQTKLTRTKVDIGMGKVYRSGTGVLAKVLEECGLASDAITDCLLAGGSSKIPKLQGTLAAFFAGEAGRTGIVKFDIPGDEVAAIGAAKQALTVSGTPIDEIETENVLTITPFDVCIKAGDGSLQTVIASGTPIPTARVFSVVTSADDQASVSLEFVERAAEPAALLTASLTGLEAAPAGETTVSVSLEISKAGQLRVSLTDSKTGKSVSGTA